MIVVLDLLKDKKVCIVEGITFSNNEEALNFNYCTNIEKDNEVNVCSILSASERIFYFKNCIFLEKLDLKELYLEKELTFDNCTFEKEIIFNDFCNDSVIFINECNFCLNDINLNNKTFKSNLFFKDCKNIGKLNLNNSTVSGSTSFRGSNFIEADFEKTTFNSIVVFNEANFLNNINFKYTSFDDRVYFQNVTIQSKLDFETTIFKDEVNFLGIKKNKEGEKLGPENIKNRETARIIKHSFEKLDNIIEANKFYALEMQKREDELSFEKVKNWLELIVFKFHKISSNHSQDWSLVLFWIFIIGFISSYLDFNLIQNENNEYVHFTFQSVIKTLGLISLIVFIDNLCRGEKKNPDKFYYLFSFYLIYSYSTNDYLLNLFSKTINPFSVMKSNEIINGFQLVFKILIAYLIYQFIISIRQNTRRK